MTLAELKEKGFASYLELKEHITRKIDLGTNEFGFKDKIVELSDGTQWDYLPEDNLYEIRQTPYYIEITHY